MNKQIFFIICLIMNFKIYFSDFDINTITCWTQKQETDCQVSKVMQRSYSLTSIGYICKFMQFYSIKDSKTNTNHY